ncbi:hypothetical protein [Sagittula stellata]|uniref:Integrase, catalytic domain n=1 Tax=Sagittula stellata (strain ATCC 700073 / DSM 11524 / E-37) TaxID=388399 RepID=A3KBE4_SAGS3|nr:hypothetical protein [Sagittula stellata]EBA05508.1 Integrase, catalytic domain [Sagittula stellata E-37]
MAVLQGGFGGLLIKARYYMGFTKRIPEPLSATRSRFAFGEYDEVIIDGISYRPSESNEFGYTFRRTDLLSVAESFTHAMLSQRVNSGEIEHRRDAFLPDHAKRRLNLPTQELSALSLKQQQKAKYHESLIRAFLEMEAEGKVKRTEESVKAALAEIKFRASKYLSVPSEATRSRHTAIP